ncbi:MAG: hypothetical protein NTW75_15080 [Planctomycetales bacterium]|mgnify:CR=1 FL=1|jgi:hypothetical protein|nr:hypothetical protein [Planctomycetales bacterium]
MVFRRNPEPGRQAATWLATAFVLVAGAGSCAFTIFLAVENPTKPLVVCACLFGGIILLLVSLWVPKEHNIARTWFHFWIASHDQTDPSKVLRLRRKKTAAPRSGLNQPPTLESVREAAEQANSVYWVPHGSHSNQSPRSR